MFDKDRILFSLVGLIGDDMLFPDWSSGQEILVYKGESYTLDKDAFVIISKVASALSSDTPNVTEVYIKGVKILKHYTVNALPVIALKGDVFSVHSSKNGNISLFVIPLIKQGGG